MSAGVDITAWQEIAVVVGIVGAIGGVWWRLNDKIGLVQSNLDNFRVEVAQNYVTNEAVGRLEGRLEEGFRSLREEQAETRRLFIEALAKAPR